jgi:hypothetical protein
VHLRKDHAGAAAPMMLLRWQSWVPERGAYIRVLNKADAVAAYPELAPTFKPHIDAVFVLHDGDGGSPILAHTGFTGLIVDAADRGLVVQFFEFVGRLREVVRGR